MLWRNPHHSERQPPQVWPLHYLPPPGGCSKEEESFLPSRGSGDVGAQVPIPGIGVPAFLYQPFYHWGCEFSPLFLHYSFS